MTGRTILAIDSGTQSVRAILFDERGEQLAEGRCAHQPLLRPERGSVEQDPDDIWRSMVTACRACMEQAERDGLPPPRAIGLTSQRKVLIPCDRTGEALHPALHWLDRRSARPRKPGMLGRAALALSGEQGTISMLVGISQGNVLRDAYPDVYNRAEYLLTITGWLTYRLTGGLRDAQGSITGVYPYDLKKGAWRTSAAMFDLLGFKPSHLPALAVAGEELGRITPAAAAETGLPVGTPLVAVGGDKQAEVLGAGVTPWTPGIAEISMGTGTSLSVVRRRLKMSLTFRWLANNAAQPDAWVHEYMVFRGFWTWTWYLNPFAPDHRQTAAEGGRSADELLSEEVSAVAPGAEGLMVIPRWYPTLEDMSERGTVLGFTEHHTRAHVARAIVEGIAMDLRRGAELMEEAFSPRIRRLRIGGGGARSPWAVQTVADVFDMPVEIPHTDELSALGAAINAAVAAGIHPDHGTAAEAMVRIDRVIEPEPRTVSLYHHQYKEGFLPAMEALKPIYGTLHGSS